VLSEKSLAFILVYVCFSSSTQDEIEMI